MEHTGSASSTCTRWCTARRPRNFPSTRFPLQFQFTSKNPTGGASSALLMPLGKPEREITVSAELILHNAKIATNGGPSFVEAIAITAGKIAAAGKDEEILRLRGPQTRVIDGRRRTVIPGLNDSHMHPIRGGLNYNFELRSDGVPSLDDLVLLLKEQGARTPAPQWGRVILAWAEFHLRYLLMPTLR